MNKLLDCSEKLYQDEDHPEGLAHPLVKKKKRMKVSETVGNNLT